MPHRVFAVSSKKNAPFIPVVGAALATTLKSKVHSIIIVIKDRNTDQLFLTFISEALRGVNIHSHVHAYVKNCLGIQLDS